MPCKVCGERYEGDGYSEVLHCPNADDELWVYDEPDSAPVDCTGEEY